MSRPCQMIPSINNKQAKHTASSCKNAQISAYNSQETARQLSTSVMVAQGLYKPYQRRQNENSSSQNLHTFLMSSVREVGNA